ncbi:MAG: Gfo/Idh/MocA family oxidoreductase [Proteobacteria bacterium]|nr:Gfo/Idh/MocA family oxidoreductase [Pseudomonadota bacterium]
MSSKSVKLGIVGLGRWARVLTRAAGKSEKLEIACGFSRSQEKRDAYQNDCNIACADSMEELLANPEIKGIILTVPNEQHLPVAEQVARAGKHIYTEKPIANTLENGLQIEALQHRYGIQVMVGHSARLLKGTRMIKAAIDSGEIGRVSLIEANFSNERALELTPDTWRWYRDKAPGGPLSQLATHQFDALHYLGGEIEEVVSMAARLSPVGAEVDDQSLTLMRFKSGAVAYVGSCWTSPGIYSIRLFGQKGLMHYELDFSTWDTPDKLHETSELYIQRGKNGFSKREILTIPPGDMFQDELEMFAEVCAGGNGCELSAANGNVAVAVVYAALRSIENNGAAVKLQDIFDDAQANIETPQVNFI